MINDKLIATHLTSIFVQSEEVLINEKCNKLPKDNIVPTIYLKIWIDR